MRALGDDQDAARVLAEHHRDRGEEAEAARCFEEAGELLAAGDLYRLLEEYAKAGDCYERQGECAQAAEMFAMAGDRPRAAANYEQAGVYAEAAECFALAGDDVRELLAKAAAYRNKWIEYEKAIAAWTPPPPEPGSTSARRINRSSRSPTGITGLVAG